MPSQSDLLFGKLVVMNRYATQAQVEECVQLQDRYRADGVDLGLGEILVKKKLMSQDQVISLLRAQRYLEVRSLDIKFGELALRNGMLTQDKLNDCLSEQERHFKAGREFPRIGQLLLDRKYMSVQQVNAILKTQSRLKDALTSRVPQKGESGVAPGVGAGTAAPTAGPTAAAPGAPAPAAPMRRTQAMIAPSGAVPILPGAPGATARPTSVPAPSAAAGQASAPRVATRPTGALPAAPGGAPATTPVRRPATQTLPIPSGPVPVPTPQDFASGGAGTPRTPKAPTQVARPVTSSGRPGLPATGALPGASAGLPRTSGASPSLAGTSGQPATRATAVFRVAAAPGSAALAGPAASGQAPMITRRATQSVTSLAALGGVPAASGAGLPADEFSGIVNRKVGDCELMMRLIRVEDPAKKTGYNLQVLTLSGTLDGKSFPHLEELLNTMMDQGNYHFILNGCRLEYISSAGMGVLIAVARRSRDMRGDIRLCQLLPKVRSIIDMLGFSNYIKVFDNEPSAIESYRGPGGLTNG
ncbi:MAG: anti-sigma factor antagonist [Planctomycetes bacterium]|nr:anti-sigma factor antagonist [Planctomycetota bacterium]